MSIEGFVTSQQARLEQIQQELRCPSITKKTQTKLSNEARKILAAIDKAQQKGIA